MRKVCIFLAVVLAMAVEGGVEYFRGDLEAELQRADRERKRVVVSLGREICGRCQKFYKLLDEGKLVFDASVKNWQDSLNAVVYRQGPAASQAPTVMGSEVSLYLTVDPERIP